MVEAEANLRRRPREQAGEQWQPRAEEEAIKQAAEEAQVAQVDRTSLWFRYKHLLPVPITLVAGIILTAIMTPYFLSPLIANIKKNDPHLTGFKLFDKFLGFVVPFFKTMANSQDYGIYPLGYFVTNHLGWQMAGAIESSRADATKSVFVRHYCVIVTAALVIGSYIITPLFWIVPYLNLNKLPSAALTSEDVRPKCIHHLRARACFVVIATGFFPFLAGMMLSHHNEKFVRNTAIFFTTPLLWPLFWRPFGSLTADNMDPVKGHITAMNALLVVGGGCMAWHFFAIIAVYREPSIVTNLLRVFTHYEGDLHTVLFITVDEIILWAGFLMIPLAQEGIRAATLFVLMTILTGPGAAVAFYFWWREGKYSEKYSSSERPWLHQFVSQIDWLVAEA